MEMAEVPVGYSFATVRGMWVDLLAWMPNEGYAPGGGFISGRMIF